MLIREVLKEHKKIGNQYLTLCPFHAETRPSFYFTDNDLFYCFGCGISGNRKKFMKLMKIPEVSVDNEKIVKQEDIVIKSKYIDDKYILLFKRSLWNCNERFFELLLRGIKPFVIKEFNIGWDPYYGYYTIPYYEAGGLVNIKLHNSHKEPKSFWYFKGRKVKVLYPYKMLKYNKLVLCEGEMDTMLLHSFGINAITSPAGASYFPDEWRKLFIKKKVYIVYDNDPAGEAGANLVFDKIKSVCKVEIIKILEKDVTELYIRNRKEFNKLMETIK